MIVDVVIPSEFLAIIKRREGLRLVPYKDTKGIGTIGYGHNLLDPISPRAAAVILEDDTIPIAHQVAGVVGDALWATLAAPRQWALVDMGFMGPAKLALFKKMLAAVAASDWKTAAQEVIDSHWAQDVGHARADEVATMLLTGEWPAAA